MIVGLDHLTLAVRDIDAAVEGYSRLLGREALWLEAPGGRRAWFQFPNLALALIAPEGGAAQTWLDANGPGHWALSFAAPEVEAAARLLNRRGIRTADPADGRTTDGEGRERAWRSAACDPSDTAGLQLALVAHPGETAPPPAAKAVADEEAAVAALDHVVIQTANVDRALAIYGAKLNLDLRLDRASERWGARQLFFRVGDAVLEIGASLTAPASDKPDRFGGLAWRVIDPDAAQARIAAAGFDVSEVRTGRKPGTKVFTVRDAPAGVPTLMLSAEPALESA